MELIQEVRTLNQQGVKDLLITRQNATTTAANLLIKFGGDFSSDRELLERLTKLADGIVSYHWKGIQQP